MGEIHRLLTRITKKQQTYKEDSTPKLETILPDKGFCGKKRHCHLVLNDDATVTTWLLYCGIY